MQSSIHTGSGLERLLPYDLYTSPPLIFNCNLILFNTFKSIWHSQIPSEVRHIDVNGKG